MKTIRLHFKQNGFKKIYRAKLLATQNPKSAMRDLRCEIDVIRDTRCEMRHLSYPASRIAHPAGTNCETERARIPSTSLRTGFEFRICFWLALLVTAGLAETAGAWTTANRYGGSTTHTYGSTTHTNAYGGSTSHAYGEGTQHTNMYGGSTSHGWYGGTTHTNVYGGSTSGAYGAGYTHTYASGASYYHPPVPTYPAYHPAYPVYPYHPPVAVPYYSAAGCYGCAAAAGAVVGMATGAAVASATTAAATSTAYSAGVAAGSANTAAAMSGAATPVVATPPTTYVMGANYAMLPSGCATPDVGGKTYFLCGNTWFQPSFGANGVYYTVVPTP